MANPPRLRVTGLPNITAEEQAATTSPARGAEMLNFLQTRLNQKNRAPALVHSWEFWHDRQDRSHVEDSDKEKEKMVDPSSYEERLELLAQISDVKAFWSVFNNFSITQLALRDSIHLFHLGVKPVWEDPRNTRGGAWTFRVPKSLAPDFWKEICMMAVGEKFQQAVEEGQEKKTSFRDDICGVSLSVRFNSMLVQIWNRDAEHEEGIQRIKESVLEGVSEELRPREGSFYYKRHNEHAGFNGGTKKETESATHTSAGEVVTGNGT